MAHTRRTCLFFAGLACPRAFCPESRAIYAGKASNRGTFGSLSCLVGTGSENKKIWFGVHRKDAFRSLTWLHAPVLGTYDDLWNITMKYEKMTTNEISSYEMNVKQTVLASFPVWRSVEAKRKEASKSLRPLDRKFTLPKWTMTVERP